MVLFCVLIRQSDHRYSILYRMCFNRWIEQLVQILSYNLFYIPSTTVSDGCCGGLVAGSLLFLHVGFLVGPWMHDSHCFRGNTNVRVSVYWCVCVGGGRWCW